MIKDVAPLPGYQEPYGLLTAVLQDATRDWRNELWQEVPPEAVTWRAHPSTPSIGAIILHMIAVELYWFEVFVLDEKISDEDKQALMWDQIDVDNDIWPDVDAQPIQQLYALQDRYRARSLETIKRWPEPTIAKTHYEDVQATAPWVLGHVIQHESYHGGQIIMLYELWKRREEFSLKA